MGDTSDKPSCCICGAPAKYSVETVNLITGKRESMLYVCDKGISKEYLAGSDFNKHE